jgi:hypothetical protein
MVQIRNNDTNKLVNVLSNSINQKVDGGRTKLGKPTKAARKARKTSGSHDAVRTTPAW